MVLWAPVRRRRASAHQARKWETCCIPVKWNVGGSARPAEPAFAGLVSLLQLWDLRKAYRESTTMFTSVYGFLRRRQQARSRGHARGFPGKRVFGELGVMRLGPRDAPLRELAVKSVGKPDAGNRHVRFDERGWETGRRLGVCTRARPRLYSIDPQHPNTGAKQHACEGKGKRTCNVNRSRYRANRLFVFAHR